MFNIFESIGNGFRGLKALATSSGSTSTSSLLNSYAPIVAEQIGQSSQELWDREDSAYQRMVVDMKKAGLNPWTGISSGGLSSGSNVPAMDSLTGLLSVLSTSFDAQRTSETTYKNRTDYGFKLGNLINQTLGTLSDVVGTFSKASK